MKRKAKTSKELLAENEDLRARLAAAEKALSAMQPGGQEAPGRRVEREQLEAELLAVRTQADRRAAEVNAAVVALTEAVLIYDPDGRIVRANPAAVKALGFDPLRADIAGLAQRLSTRRPDGRLLNPADTPAARALRGQVVSGEHYLFTNAAGQTAAVIVSASPLLMAGRISGAVSVWHDVTELEQTRDDARRRADELDTIFRSIPDAVTIYDREGRIIRTNGLSENFAAYAEADTATPLVEGASSLQVLDVHGKPVRAEDRPAQRALAGETVLGQVLCVVREAQDPLWISSSAAPLYKDGVLAGAVATVTDITRLKQTEEALRESEMRFKLALKNAPVSVAAQDRDLRFLWAYNQRTVPVSEIVGKTDADLFPPEDAARLTALKRTVLETGAEVREKMWVTSGGQRVFLDLLLEPMRDGAGNVVGIGIATIDLTQIKLADDKLEAARAELEIRVQERTHALADTNAILEKEIGERKQAEELLRQNARRIEILAEISHALAAVGSDFGAVLDRVAQSTARSIGDACVVRLISDDEQRLELAACYHSDPAAQETVRRILCAGPEGVAEGITGRVFRTQRPLIMANVTADELRLSAKSIYQPLMEQVGLFSLLAVPLMAEGNAVGTLSLFRTTPDCPYTADDLKLLQSIADRAAMAITNARLYRELKEALAEEQTVRRQLIQTEKFTAMGRLMGSVAHELNNPLQTITNCLYLTQRHLAPDTAPQEYLTMATAETERMISLVAQLRELYRARPTGEAELTELADLLQNVQALTAAQLQSQNIQWQSLAGPPGCRVICSRDRLKQVFINIVINAVEAMQPQGGILSVDVALADDGQRVKVTFKDTGPGIPPEHLNNLFEPLFTTKSHGLGLGLAICYEILQQHSGQITVESRLGEGAAFTVWLPVAASAGLPDCGPMAPRPAPDATI